jgi:hypothetical protein
MKHRKAIPTPESNPQRVTLPVVLRALCNTVWLLSTDLKLYRLGESGPDARRASDTEFFTFASSIARLEGEKLDHWTVEERRDFLNWCPEMGLIESRDGVLHVKGPDVQAIHPAPKTGPQ